MSMVQTRNMGGAKLKFSGMSMKERMACVRAHKKNSGGIAVGGALSAKNIPFGGIAVGGKKHKKGGLFLADRMMGGEAVNRHSFLQQQPWGARIADGERIGGLVVGGKKHRMGGIPVGGMVEDEFLIDGGARKTPAEKALLKKMNARFAEIDNPPKKKRAPRKKKVSMAEMAPIMAEMAPMMQEMAPAMAMAKKMRGRPKLGKSFERATSTPMKKLKLIKKVLFPVKTKAHIAKYGEPIHWAYPEYAPYLDEILNILMKASVENADLAHLALTGEGRRKKRSSKMRGGFGWGDIWDGVKMAAPLLPLLL